MHEILLPRRRLMRLYQSYRHPDQAAIAARLPILGERVPVRAFWRRQRVDPQRMLSHGSGIVMERTHEFRTAASSRAAIAAQGAKARLPVVRERVKQTGKAVARKASDQMPEVRARAASVGQQTVSRAQATGRGTISGARATGRATTAIARRTPRGRLFRTASLFALGALLMFFLDPQSGRRRRARARDKMAHLRRVVTRDLPKTAERRGRFVRGIARGVRHDAAEMLPHRHTIVDDETLVARVRSEVLRRADVPAGEIHVDAYEGCVTLRGQLDESNIRRVMDATRRVEGVTQVRSYLHLPGTPPPNKAESMMAEANGHMPAHMQR